MRGHFLDSSTHKRDFFRIFLEKTNEPFCDLRGPGFNHGINCLMLALLQQPTTPEEFESEGKKETVKTSTAAPTRAKKVRPVLEQQKLGYEKAEAVETTPEATTEVAASVRKSERSAFSEISEMIRDSDGINKIWRGNVFSKFVEMFHGIPPCFHCRVEEGKQIHHQNPLFHEIVLINLNKLATTAEEVLEQKNKGNNEPFEKLSSGVFTYHLAPNAVLAVPYCQNCNRDAELKRKRGKRDD